LALVSANSVNSSGSPSPRRIDNGGALSSDWARSRRSIGSRISRFLDYLPPEQDADSQDARARPLLSCGCELHCGGRGAASMALMDWGDHEGQ